MEHRVSNSQLEALLDFLDSHPAVAKGVGLGCRSKENIEKEWDRLAITLNAHGGGSTKTGKRWKRYWADLKHKTKSRIAQRNRSIRSTGGGPPDTSDLSDIDKKVLAIIGEAAVFGDTQHRVPLFPSPATSSSQVEQNIESHQNIVPLENNLVQEEIVIEEPDTETIGSFILNSPSARGHTSRISTVEIPAPSVAAASTQDAVPQQEYRDESHPMMGTVSPASRHRNPRRRQITRRRLNMPSSQFIVDHNWVIELEQRRIAAEEKMADSVHVLAESSRIIAEVSKTNAESSRITAEASKTNAESSRITAEASKTNAESSRIVAEASKKSSESIQTLLELISKKD